MPMLSSIRENLKRFSALSMLSADVPRMLTLPVRSNFVAMLFGICPPMHMIRPSGFSS